MFAVPSLVYRPQYVLRRTIINSLLLLPPSELAIEPLSEQLAHMADDMMIAATERTPSSCYVLFLAEVAAANAWVAASADDVLKVYDNETGVLRATLSGHTKTITDVVSGVAGQASIASSSLDGTVRVWDLRSNEVAHITRVGGRRELYSCSIGGSSGMKLAGAGSSSVHVWDLAAPGVVTSYLDSHTEDVTQVRFHATHADLLYSASVDGLVCQFDTSVADEDDALLTVLPIEDSVRNIGFIGGSHLYAITHTELVSVFNLETEQRVVDRCNVRQAYAANGIEVDFVVDCQADAEAGRLLVLTGTSTGVVHATHLTDTGELHPVLSLEGGHNEPVRTCYWNFEKGFLLTGGEDARVCVWSSPDNTLWTPAMLSDGADRTKAPIIPRFKPY